MLVYNVISKAYKMVRFCFELLLFVYLCMELLK